MNQDERVKCNDCGDFLEEEEFVHSVNYGYWDSEKDGLEDSDNVEFYCRSCWNSRSPMRDGIEMEVESAEELLNTLKATDGKIVADFNSHIVGSRAFLRCIEGRVENAYVKARRVGEGTISFSSKFEERTEEEAIEFIDKTIIEGDLPSTILLVSRKDTPFDDYPDISSDQSTIERF